MDIFRGAERLMTMDDATWARHANPWSVWTRVAILPLLTLAIWSRVWLGWAALVPLGLVLIWTWINPRLFPAPKRLDSWAAQGVMGERLFLADRKPRGVRTVPAHHRKVAHLLTGVSVLGLGPFAWGLWRLDPWATLFGLSLIMIGKLWFVDRMVWLYRDMSDG